MNIGAGEWVVYRPPKSVSFGHQSRIRDPRRAWPMVQQFMADLTRFTLGDRIELMCYGSGPQTNADVAAARTQEARRSFGPEVERQGTHQTFPSWRISEAQLASAVRFALDDDKFPKQEAGPSYLAFSYQFCWNEFDSGLGVAREIESRRILSFLIVTIGQQRLFLQPHFVYPAAWNSDPLKDFIDRSELIAPFRFRDQYFVRWLPPQSPGSHGRRVRLEATWRRGSVSH
jgi:hypothetical protein